MTKKNFFLILLTGLSLHGSGQTCTSPGQTPVSALLVCGTASIYQTTPSLCGQTNIPVPCSDGGVYQNINPNFFRMGCYATGTLGFSILPDDPNANYNWQLFDITNTNPSDIFSNSSLFVACNWSSDPGETGASIDGTNLVVCSGPGQPLFSKMPVLQQGRTYLLMVSNQSNSGSGFQLSFDGGSAVIIDPVPPRLLQTSLNCDASRILVRLSKPVMCSSIAVDGSDFSISGGAVITGAIPFSCTSSEGTTTITLLLNQSLSNGNYTLTVNSGTDGNTLLDICGFSIASGENINVNAGPLIPTPIDSVKPVGCSPTFIELIFKRPILCSSIAPDGSDFVINGPQNVSATVSPTNCANRTNTFIIRLNLSAPLIAGGNYSVQLKNGNDGNTIIDECGLSTPAGSSVSFNVRAAVSADFNYSINSSCKTDTVSFSHSANNGVNQWNWSFDNISLSSVQNPVKVFTDTGSHSIRLVVSNGSCTDSVRKIINLQNRIHAAFTVPAGVCPGDSLLITNKSTGNITNWYWDFGNGNSSNLASPPFLFYPPPGRDASYNIRLIATNSQTSCSDTIQKTIKAMAECYVLVPSGFTPNGDGLNDFLSPLNTKKATGIEFSVYNRSGQLVFKSDSNGKKWDGKINGVPQDTGLYGWMLSYINRDTGKKVFLKGTTLLIR